MRPLILLVTPIGEADLSNCKAVVKTLESTQRTDLAGDLKSAFATFDSNQDGSVSITELTHVRSLPFLPLFAARPPSRHPS